MRLTLRFDLSFFDNHLSFSDTALMDTLLPARYYLRMGELLDRMGIALPPLLQAAGIAPQALGHPESQLSLRQIDRLVELALQRSGRSDLALELGKTLQLSTHSIVGFGMLASPTLGEALGLAARFFRLILPSFRMRVSRRDGQTNILYEPVLPHSHTSFVFHLEAIIAATHSDARELLDSELPPYSVYLSIDAPPHHRRYQELAGAHCHFGCAMPPGARLVMPAELMQRALKKTDPSALHMAESRCKSLLRTAVGNARLADWVGMMLREAADGLPSQVELAHTLNLTPRTLDRRLRREGVGFRDLARQARLDKARELLAGPLSVTQIAYELGYRDAANFTRAFRRETGQTPSDWRASCLLSSG